MDKDKNSKKIIIEAYYIYNRVDLFCNLIAFIFLEIKLIQQTDNTDEENKRLDEELNKIMINVWKQYVQYEKSKTIAVNDYIEKLNSSNQMYVESSDLIHLYKNLKQVGQILYGYTVIIQTDRPEDVMEWLDQIPRPDLDIVVEAREPSLGTVTLEV